MGVKTEQKGDVVMRGSIEGGLWALVLGTAGLSFASLAAEQPVVVASVQVPQMDTPALAQTVPDTGLPSSNVSAQVETTRPAAPVGLDQPVPDAGFADISSTVPPALIVDAAPTLRPPQDGRAPVLRQTTTSPVLVAPLAPLIVPIRSGLPDIDLATPAPPVAQVAQADVTAELSQPQPTPDDVPQVDTSQAPVAVTMPVPQIIAPPVDDAQAVQPDTLMPSGTGVRVNRPSTDATEPAGLEAAIVAPEDVRDDLPALATFAASFENPDNLPVIGIVLVDDGSMANGAAALADLGFAPTVVINALDTDASARMAAYRAAGAEVAVQIQLPEGAQPADVEVAFAEAFRLMPDVAMLYSDGSGVLQSSRSVTGQVMEVLAADGHGFVTVQRGLGNAARAATQEGVPAATIDRELDSNGESSAAIGRALDQAGFRARQSGGAVLMGRLQQDTLTALRTWAEAAADDAVAPAPVSAVLLRLPE